ncbi:MAG: S41 family peptidase [Vitreimonas sp.]
MSTRRTVLLGMAAAGIAPASWAEDTLRGADLRGDIAILRDAYETLHPGLYRYATPTQMSGRFDALARAFAHDQTRAEAYLSLSRFLASVRCGHTYANFYNQRGAVREALFDPLPRLPVHFVWLGPRMVVVANFSGDARLARGAEILSIDGRAVARIQHDLLAYARADGGNDAKRRALLEVRGFDGYETFDIFYGLAYRPSASFRLRVRSAGGSRIETFDVAAADLAARRAAMRTQQNDDAPNWTLSYPQAGTALLTMPSWALYNSHWDWRAFLDTSFAEINRRAVTKLIVDVRGNEGGLDCGDDIVARLIDAPLQREGFERRVRYRQTPDRLNPYLDTWDDSFRNWGADAESIDARFFRLRSDDGDAIAPKGPRFRGELIVLTDAENSSATFQFAQMVQQKRLGRLIGQPTGGNQRGINGGAFFFVRLPASGLEADLPLIGRFPLTPKPDAGLTPDIVINLTAADVATGRDAVMEATLNA